MMDVSDLLTTVLWYNSFNFTNQKDGNNSLSIVAVRVGLTEPAYILTTL
jgi:hypothetical protein